MKNGPRIGVIGAGYWGEKLVRVCAELGVLAAVCDADTERLRSVTATYKDVMVFRDPDMLLQSDVDAVVIASPADTHAKLALAAICHGKQVFVEKPLAMTVDDAVEIARLARSFQRLVFVGHLLLYHPGITALLSALRDGRIGKLLHVRSRRLSLGRVRTQENVWWSFAPHDVALMLAIFDEFPIAARAQHHGHVVPGVSDFAYVDYLFGSGRSAHIEVGWLDANKSSRVDVFGTEGILSFEDSRSGGQLTLTPCGARLNDNVAQTWSEAPISIPFEKAEPLKAEMLAFLHAIQTQKIPPTDVREGVEVVRALALADDAAQYNLHDLTPPVAAPYSS